MLASIVSLVLPASAAEPDAARSPSPPVSRVPASASLGRCIELAERNHPNLLAERARLSRTRAQLQEARIAPFTQFRATGGFGIAPTVRGDGIFSPNTDQSLTSNMGMAWRFDVSGAVPLWTFGKITSLWDAAEAAVKVGEEQVQVTRDEVRFDVRKAYYGLLLARSGLELLGDALAQIDEAAKKLEVEVEAEEADAVDLLKLQTYQSELRARLSEAARFEQVARAGLRYYTGVADLEVRPTPLEVGKHRLGHLATYLAAARIHRPEVRMARAGLDARSAQVKLAQAQLFPDVGVGLSFGASYAPEVSNQINPYVPDPGNYFRYGLGFVFQWNLDFPGAYARVMQAQAQLQEMVALDKKALGGVAAEVEAAYAEAVDWQKRVDAFAQAEKYARKWLATVQQSIDVGTMDEKEIIDPARRWAENRWSRLNATMEFNMALAKLARVTGWDVVAPDG
jgi:outer membrane protein TolC